MTTKIKTRLKGSLTPVETVKQLDRFIVGQQDAKKAVAIALRNRRRRQAVPEALRQEIIPKNILMVGPTGVGKTEIARRLANLAEAPFIKVEATKFTEIGYVGRDVESVVRDLLEVGIFMLRERQHKAQRGVAKKNAEEKMVKLLVGEDTSETTREKFRKMLLDGELDSKDVEISVKEPKSASTTPMFEVPGMNGAHVGIMNLSNMMDKLVGGDKKPVTKTMKVKEALQALVEEETENLVSEDKIVKEAMKLVEDEGIIFIDEIDKIVSSSEGRGRGDVSREGVQRDLLPLIEGTTVATRHGSIKTDHILFIASGAFHMSRPSDLLPELQGRLPIRVELTGLKQEDLVRILEEPEASLIKQYVALLATEGVELKFTKEAIHRIADVAFIINRDVENIGARRLHTILEKLLEDISFSASEEAGKTVEVNEEYVEKQLSSLTKQLDLSKFIL
jgi:ATP-dependent HslUV protease ATP-binding subunit HslU